MAYTYQLMTYLDVTEDLRGIFGVDSAVLPDATIHRLTNLPAAELQVLALVSNPYILTESQKTVARLAVLFFAAASCLQIVKINLLQKETDNKTSGERFKDALNLTEDGLRNRGQQYLSKLLNELGLAGDKGSIFELSKPATDVITGNPYA